MIPIVESVGLPDHWWPSAIGNKQGDIYENVLELAKNSRLNKDEVPSYF